MIRITDVIHPTDPKARYKKNRFCGPSALSALTGIDTGRAAALIRKETGSYSVKGTANWAMLRVLRNLGYAAIPFPASGTLRQWMLSTREERGSDAFLVNVTRHYVVVQGMLRVCSLLKETTMFDETKGLKAQVESVWKIVKIKDVNIDTLLPEASKRGFKAYKKKKAIERKAASPENAARRQAIKLADEYDISLDWYDGKNKQPPNAVYPPDGLYLDDENDPYYDQHHEHYTWKDVLEKVETYIADIKSDNRPRSFAEG